MVQICCDAIIRKFCTLEFLFADFTKWSWSVPRPSHRLDSCFKHRSRDHLFSLTNLKPFSLFSPINLTDSGFQETTQCSLNTENTFPRARVKMLLVLLFNIKVSSTF